MASYVCNAVTKLELDRPVPECQTKIGEAEREGAQNKSLFIRSKVSQSIRSLFVKKKKVIGGNFFCTFKLDE